MTYGVNCSSVTLELKSISDTANTKRQYRVARFVYEFFFFLSYTREISH